jgi:hypothetical protein
VKALKLATWVAAILATADGVMAQNTVIPPPPAGTTKKADTTPAAVPAPATTAPGTTPATAIGAPAATTTPAPATNRVAVPSQFRRPNPGTTNPIPVTPGSARPASGAPTFRPGTGVPQPPGGGGPRPPGANPAAGPVSAADQEANDAAVEAAKAARDSGDLNALIATVKFKNMALEQVLDAWYAPLTGRTVLRGQGLNMALQITYFPTKALSVEETIQALDTVMALNQITTIPMGDNFILVVPSSRRCRWARSSAIRAQRTTRRRASS